MHPRAVELGWIYGVPIVVRSSFNDGPGTLIRGGMNMEVRNKVVGIAHDADVPRITVAEAPDKPGVAYSVFQALADANVSVDVIVQSGVTKKPGLMLGAASIGCCASSSN